MATLVRRYGAHRLSDIEDSVQFAMTQALSHWRKDEIPNKPGAWLSRVAQRRLIDTLRRDTRWSHDSEALPELVDPSEEHAPRLQQELQSDQLSMLFVCCDPKLAPQTQMVLALKTLCGFSTQEIALRLFLSPAAVQKRLSRARTVLRESWARPNWQQLPLGALDDRIDAVLCAVYLLFNEGYASIRGQTPIRRELCDEAIFLGQTLLAHPTGDIAQAHALLALMYFHRARFEARQDSQGQLILLEAQDRSLWDPGMIRSGLTHFTKATEQDVFSRYHGEAAIALQHCIAPHYDQTNWEEIADLYSLLAKMIPSPIYILNAAIAIAQAQGPSAGIEALQDTKMPQWLQSYYLWDATIGEMHRRNQDFERAQTHLQRALSLAPDGWDKELIAARLQSARESSDSKRS